MPDFCAAVIHSQARFDYPGVAAALAGDTRGKRRKYEPHLPMLRDVDALARQLRRMRMNHSKSCARRRSSQKGPNRSKHQERIIDAPKGTAILPFANRRSIAAGSSG